MTLRTTLSTVLLLGLSCTLSAMAQERGYWKPASKTAQSITGELTFANEKLTIDFSSYAIAQIRPLKPDEVLAAFETADATAGTGHLYRLSIPGDKRFLHKNTLCGTDDTQWMATYVSGRSLLVDFFSGSNPPVLTFDALSNAPNLCGTFTYGR